MRKTFFAAAGIAALLGTGQAHAATSVLVPYSLTTTTYTQGFNGLATSGESAVLPAGFQLSETGSNATTVDGNYTASDGSSNSGDVYSFGSTGSTERALGSLYSGTNSPLFGGIFTNGLGAAITSLTFNFTGEQWRAAAGTSDRLDFQYLVGATSIDSGTWIDFNTLDILSLVNGGAATLDGNAAANRAGYAGTINLNVAAGQTFGFRFVDIDGPGGADAGLGLDDLTLTATTAQIGAVPEPATWAMMVAGFGLLGGAMRRRRTAVRFA